jgi:hypothetical protein
VHHPLGCHRRRIPDRIVIDNLIQVLVFGCGDRRIADATCSASTLRRRRDEWISADVAEQLHRAVLAAYHRRFGLELECLAVDGCRPRRPAAGRLPAPVRWIVAGRAEPLDHGRGGWDPAGGGAGPATTTGDGRWRRPWMLSA